MRYLDRHKSSAWGEFDCEISKVESSATTLILANQPAIDLPQAPSTDFTFIIDLAGCNGIHFEHCNNVFETQRSHRDFLHILRANEPGHYVASSEHSIIYVSIPEHEITAFLDEHGRTEECLVPFYGHLREVIGSASLAKTLWDYNVASGGDDRLLMDSAQMTFLAMVSGFANRVGVRETGQSVQIIRAIDFIEENLDTQLSVATLAHVVGLGRSEFASRFKAEIGKPVWSYVQSRRLEVAKKLLSETNTALSSIAFQTGFSSQSHFSNCFRQKFGIAPAAYRASFSL